jgi:hypothetical protein
VDVTAQSIELGDNDRAFGFPRCRQCGGQFGTLAERVTAFAGLDLDEALDNLEALGLGKAGDGCLLRFETKA